MFITDFIKEETSSSLKQKTASKKRPKSMFIHTFWSLKLTTKPYGLGSTYYHSHSGSSPETQIIKSNL